MLPISGVLVADVVYRIATMHQRPSIAGYDSKFLDEQFRIATTHLIDSFFVVVVTSMIATMTAAQVVYNAHSLEYSLEHSLQEIVAKWFFFRVGATLVMWAMIFAAHKGIITIPVAREILHTVVTFVPIMVAIRSLLEIDPNHPSEGTTSLLLAQLRALAVMPVLIGILVRLPFWSHLLWSRLTTLVIATVCSYQLLPPDQHPAEANTQVFIAGLSLLVAYGVEQAHIENYNYKGTPVRKRRRQVTSTQKDGGASRDMV
jgi:hypothetical protein